jgi:ketosteroid isomerase-like protein
MKSRLVLLAALAAACGPRLLPGTDIREDKDTRAVYDELLQYKQAMNARDAAAILALTAPDYFDNQGTPEPDDDVDRTILERQLPDTLTKIDAIRMDFTIRKIEIRGDAAIAELFYDSWYRVKTPDSKVVPRRDSDLNQIRFRRVGGKWLVTGGL